MSKISRRKKTELPALKLNAKGEFHINVDGKKVYMGRELLVAKKNLVDFIARRAVGKEGVIVSELVLKFLDEFKNHPKYQKYRRVAERLVELYGDMPVQNFGPIAFKKVRKTFVEEGLARSYVNELMDKIKHIVRFAVEEEMLPEAAAAAIAVVKALPKGAARDNPPRLDVEDGDVARTLKFALPTIRDMIIVQRVSGMRPSEIALMTMEQIEKVLPDVWVYRPRKSKTGSVVVLGKAEIEILRRRQLGKKSNDILFSPQDTQNERQKSPPKPWQNRAYSRHGYKQAVQRTIQKANKNAEKNGLPPVPHGTPYQLRHASATFLSLLYDRETARQQLGHANPQTTTTYDHSELKKKIALVPKRNHDQSPEMISAMALLTKME